MKREEQTLVLEMLVKDYISVKICVILLTKFNSYLCLRGPSPKDINTKKCV
jgi:hypothetical protein